MSTNEHLISPISPINEHRKIEVRFEIASKQYEIYFRSDDISLTGNIEAYLTCALLPCMRHGGVLLADGEVSQRFISSIPKIQDIYCAWDSSLQRVQIQNIIPVVKGRENEDRIGTFFSGGVDSFYTFLKNREEITDLIFVNGLDIPLGNISLYARTSEMIHEIASRFGKHVIEIETNVRALVNPYAHWGLLAHGAVLSTIGHLLSPVFSQIYIPATHTYAELFPWGSHPILDPLWSTETLEYVHDGCEAKRIDKVALIAEFDIALQGLRVCWENPNGSYNCGQCEKCIRTMINLYAVGALERCTTFDRPLNIKNVLKINAFDENTRAFIIENLNALEKRQESAELRNALRKVLNRPQWPVRVEKRVKRTVVRYPWLYQRLKRLNKSLKRQGYLHT